MNTIEALRAAVADHTRIAEEAPTPVMLKAARLLGVPVEAIKDAKLQLARSRICDAAIAIIQEAVDAEGRS
jgi:hypothetical protein